MASIIQIPDSVSLLRNLKEFIINSSTEISFSLSFPDGVILNETYHPDPTNRIAVDVQDVVSRFIETQVPYVVNCSQICIFEILTTPYSII